MPGLRHLSQTLIASSLYVAGIHAGYLPSCPNAPLSCHNSTAITNTCCTNSPGGLLLQTQFWDYNPETGPLDSWTVHGLWPDNCDGTYQQYCDTNREYTNITQILQAEGRQSLLDYMNVYWKDYQGNDESFWEHEFSKHGTCISTLDPSCYVNYTPQQEVGEFFNKTVSLFQGLPSYQFLSSAGIVPDSSKTYQLSDVQNALTAGHGYLPTIQCDSNGSINEIWYYFDTQGTTTNGTFTPTAATTSGDCPDTVKYMPKVNGTAPTATSSTTTATKTTSTPTSTGNPFTGKGYLDVSQSGSTNGCIISAGTWYTTGTCATFSAATSGSGFTLTSSKGPCSITSSNTLSCASGNTASVFGSSGSSLTWSGSTAFYASKVASGSTQQPVYAGNGAVNLIINWRSM